MKILELKLLLGALISNMLVDLKRYTSVDLLLKAVPAIVVTGFTIDKWVAFRKRRKQEDIVKEQEEKELRKEEEYD